MKGAKHGTKAFWQNVKSCTGIGKIKQFVQPWPCTTPNITAASANKLNAHFIDSVTGLGLPCQHCLHRHVQLYLVQWKVRCLSHNHFSSMPSHLLTFHARSATCLQHPVTEMTMSVPECCAYYHKLYLHV